MKNLIIARYGELHLKGGNRDFFLSVLTQNLRKRIGERAEVKVAGQRITLEDYANESEVMDIVISTFGIVSASVATLVEATESAILAHVGNLKIGDTFRVNVNRSDKSFPIKSMEFAGICGAEIIKNSKDAKIDLFTPKTSVNIDIRGGGTAYVYTDLVPAVGGLPVGTAGRCVVLLSGGIDSPVASFLAAKRGLHVEYVHFATPPYTSDFALDKVNRLVSDLEKYTGSSKLHVIPFTEISRAIQKNCDPAYMITIMRRFMIRIAEQIGISSKKPASCIITGENLAQVASQTIEGIASNNFVATKLPILRPLITFDKAEIIELAKRIGTYETSIEPHQDCCTVFVPKRPIIKPDMEKVLEEEARLDVEGLMKGINLCIY